MVKKSVGNFTIEGDVVAGGTGQSSIRQHGSADHLVRVTNRSTLPYDVIVKSKLPDPKPPRALSYQGTPSTAWRAQWSSVGGSAAVSVTRKLDVHGAAASGQRLWSHELRYRLANTATGITQGGLWTSVTAYPLPVDISVAVL